MDNGTEIEQLNNIADIAVDESLTRDKISGFLDIMYHCYTYPYFDQLLIWKQLPEATDIAGIRKWKNEGRELKSNAKPAFVLLPYIFYLTGSAVPKLTADGEIATDAQKVILYDKEPEYETGYKAVPIFDISQTTGDITSCVHDLSFLEDKIRQMGFIIFEEDEMPASKPDGYTEDNIFHIPSNLRSDMNRYNTILLNLFTEYISVTMHEDDYPDNPIHNIDIVCIMCKYCIQQYFIGKTNISPKIIGTKISNLTHDEKKDIIRHTSDLLVIIIQYLIGQEFTFYDTAIVNGLLDTPDDSELIVTFQKAERNCDKLMVDKMNSLSDKLLCASSDFVPYLYDYKQKHKIIYTSPPMVVKKPIISNPTNIKKGDKDYDR